jgi:hypothetical protein
MQIRNQDIGLGLGLALVAGGIGAFVKAGMSVLASVLISFGLLLLLGVMIQRIRADSPPKVTGDIGLKILNPEFSDGGVEFDVALRMPITTGLWLTCNVPVLDVTARLRLWGGPAHMESLGKAIRDHREYKQFVFLPFTNIDETTTKAQRAEVQVEIAVSQPLKRVRVQTATRRKIRWMDGKIRAAKSRLP